MCFSKHLVPFFYLDVGRVSKKCWRGMKVTERPSLCDGASVHSAQDKRVTTELLDAFFWAFFRHKTYDEVISRSRSAAPLALIVSVCVCAGDGGDRKSTCDSVLRLKCCTNSSINPNM